MQIFPKRFFWFHLHIVNDTMYTHAINNVVAVTRDFSFCLVV